MAKSDMTQWDTTAANNTDVSGINIAEGCPAGGINDAIRAIMAQTAAWLGSAGGPLLKSGGTMTGDVSLTYASTVKDGAVLNRNVGYRSIPLTSKSTAYQLNLTDVGQGISANSTISIPSNVTTPFAVGDTIVIYNASASSINIAPAASVTLRLAASTTTGNRMLANYGVGTLLKIGTDEWVITGAGVS